jgi:CRP-like cAMP-binding protein
MVAQIDLAQLGDVPLFRDLPRDDLETLGRLARPAEINASEWLFHQGDPADCFYVVVAGGLDLEVRTATGREHLVAHMGPGTVVGETSLFIGGQRSSSARATDRTALLEFPDEELRALLRSNALPAYHIAYRLAQALAQRLRELDAHIAQMSSLEGDRTAGEDDLDRLRRIFFTDWGAAAPRGSI